MFVHVTVFGVPKVEPPNTIITSSAWHRTAAALHLVREHPSEVGVTVPAMIASTLRVSPTFCYVSELLTLSR